MNLLDQSFYKTSHTSAGVTYTLNPDGSYHRTGTATEEAGNVWVAGTYMVDPNESNVIATLKYGHTYMIRDCILFTVNGYGNDASVGGGW